MKIAATGGAGLVGRNPARTLVFNGDQAILPEGHPAVLPSRGCDLTDPAIRQPPHAQFPPAGLDEVQTLTEAIATPASPFTTEPGAAARERMLSRRGEPLFIAAWRRVLMIHFEVDAIALQRDVPFRLDLRQGRAFVSLVAFTMQGMRPRYGGRWMARMFQPIATHDFLNFRTYVTRNGEPGIHFLAEWLTNRLAVRLGPALFGLPYRHGRIAYDFNPPDGQMRGRVSDARTRAELAFHGHLGVPPRFLPSEAGSLTGWLMERYTAFNAAGGHRRYFRVWHPPWPQCPAKMTLEDKTLLTNNWPWFAASHQLGANYSPGFDEVWMGRPHW